jgi:Carboxypeptidase regulatory-like domain
MLAFAVAANLFPDWTWEILNFRTAKIEPPEYPPSWDTEGVDLGMCPSPPKGGGLFLISVHTPQDCARPMGDTYSNTDYRVVGYPLRGWLGCINGEALKGVSIDALSTDGKERLASTITNSKGRFSFPSLKSGRYHVTVNSAGLERVDAIVTTDPRYSFSALCFVVEGKAE